MLLAAQKQIRLLLDPLLCIYVAAPAKELYMVNADGPLK